MIKRVERHTTVRERDVRLEKHEANIAVSVVVLEEGSAKMFQGVEAAASDRLSGYHGIEGEHPRAVINHEAQIGGVRFRTE